MTIKRILAGSLLTSSLVYGANSVDLNVNNNTLEISGDFSLNEAYNLNDDSNYFLTLSFLNSEDKSATNTERLTTVGFKMINPYIDDYGFKFGLGMKAVWADNSEDNFLALPIQLFGNYQIDEKINLDINLAYAPRVLSFLEAQRFISAETKINYKIIDNGYTYVGARSISTKYNNNSTIKYDQSLFFGFKVQF